MQPPPPGMARAAWENAMREAAQELFGATWTDLELSAELQAATQQLAAEKYSRSAYNEQR